MVPGKEKFRSTWPKRGRTAEAIREKSQTGKPSPNSSARRAIGRSPVKVVKDGKTPESKRPGLTVTDRRRTAGDARPALVAPKEPA